MNRVPRIVALAVACLGIVAPVGAYADDAEPPRLDTLSRGYVRAGSVVIAIGDHFGTTMSDVAVVISRVPAQVLEVSPRAIRIRVPPLESGEAPVEIRVGKHVFHAELTMRGAPPRPAPVPPPAILPVPPGFLEVAAVDTATVASEFVVRVRTRVPEGLMLSVSLVASDRPVATQRVRISGPEFDVRFGGLSAESVRHLGNWSAAIDYDLSQQAPLDLKGVERRAPDVFAELQKPQFAHIASRRTFDLGR